MEPEVVELHVRGGELVGSGSWIYLWLCADEARPVVYVGGTGLPPEVRTWLHLHDPDPEVGRLLARYPGLADESLRVLAFRLPPSLSRPLAKAAVVADLFAAGLLSPQYVGDPPESATVVDGLEPLLHAIRARLT